MSPRSLEILDGSTAVARGALDAGCTFFAGYPITPASSILMRLLRDLPAAGGVAIQAEDEIASLSMCLGAALAGARAMTASSGPGLSLMSENVGLAIMGEVPVVIVDVQRLGPSTGGATTVGQGDVQFVRWGTPGGYPIIALAPSSIPECYALTIKAFELAAVYRSPVFLLLDKELALTLSSVERDSFVRPAVSPHPKRIVSDGTSRPYRFHPAEGVADLVPIGAEELVRFTGSSHGEDGLLTKDPSTLAALNRHLQAKIESHSDDLEDVTADLEAGARTLLVSYGVTAGGMRAAVRKARSVGLSVSALTVRSLWPVPERALRRAMEGVDRVVVAELNLGDFRREVERVAAGRARVTGLHRVDGELLSPAQFWDEIEA
jgi:2-oxoglutarate ferredoxin oxidoreductase subunit alpha